MEDITVKLLDAILSDVSEDNTKDFSTFKRALIETDDLLDEDAIESILDYLVEYLSVESDSELNELSTYEKEDLVEFLKNLEY